MSTQTLGIVIGGLVPALLFGISNVLVKFATEKGISLPLYAIITGLAVLTVGIALLFLFPERVISKESGAITFIGGLIWASSMACIVIGLQRYDASISVITPLFNLNTLIAVGIGLWVFSEWKTVHVPQLLVGSFLIVIGGALVARA